jgi:heavy metal sensor kinase
VPTITTKLTSWYVGITALILIIVSISLYAVYDAESRASLDSDLASYTDLLISEAGRDASDISDFFDRLLEVRQNPKTRYSKHRFIVASKDSVVFESGVVSNLDSLVADLETGKQGQPRDEAFQTIEINGAEYRTFTRRLHLDAGGYIDLVSISPLNKLYDSLAQLRYILFVIIPISLLAAGLGGWVLARRAFAPVRAINETAAGISSEHLDRRVPVGRSQDELAVLAATFNAMIERLDSTFKAQQQFIADASHDFRTPLTVIQMELELLVMGSQTAAQSNEALERCLIEVDRLSHLASDLLLLARADSKQLVLNRKMFRFDELVVECISQLKGIAQHKSIQFSVTLNTAVEVYADEDLLRRAIINVAHNAMKFSRNESSIRVEVGCDGGTATFNLHDSGMGISEDELPHMFDRFRRAERERSSSGTGLGLAIVKAVVEAHGGTVRMTSKLNEGTSIWMEIPCRMEGNTDA